MSQQPLSQLTTDPVPWPTNRLCHNNPSRSCRLCGSSPAVPTLCTADLNEDAEDPRMRTPMTFGWPLSNLCQTCCAWAATGLTRSCPLISPLATDFGLADAAFSNPTPGSRTSVRQHTLEYSLNPSSCQMRGCNNSTNIFLADECGLPHSVCLEHISSPAKVLDFISPLVKKSSRTIDAVIRSKGCQLLYEVAVNSLPEYLKTQESIRRCIWLEAVNEPFEPKPECEQAEEGSLSGSFEELSLTGETRTIHEIEEHTNSPFLRWFAGFRSQKEGSAFAEAQGNSSGPQMDTGGRVADRLSMVFRRLRG